MTHCYNCGHAGTFVLLVECALAVPGPLSDRATADLRDGDSHVGEPHIGTSHAGDPRARGHHAEDRPADHGSCAVDPDRSPRSRRPGVRRRDPPGSNRRGHPGSRRHGDDPDGRDLYPEDDQFPGRDAPSEDLSFAVQCPVCASTDVGVGAADLLARYASSTTS